MKPGLMTPQPRLSHAELVPHWLVCTALLALLIAYNIICHVWGSEIRINLDESQRILIRTILYGVTIALFPLVNLLRHILLRLNQTMPGNKPAKQRYLLTVVVTLSLIETVGVFGFVMYLLGDDFNTLTIFSVLAALGIFLHKPNLDEYLAISEALNGETR
jgi:preprotein translocase subunit Sss1